MPGGGVRESGERRQSASAISRTKRSSERSARRASQAAESSPGKEDGLGTETGGVCQASEWGRSWVGSFSARSVAAGERQTADSDRARKRQGLQNQQAGVILKSGDNTGGSSGCVCLVICIKIRFLALARPLRCAFVLPIEVNPISHACNS
jgi:hypothetical protein